MIDQRRDDYSRARIGAAQTATSAFGIPLAVQPNVRSSSRPIESRLTAYGQFTPSPVFARHGAIAGSSCSIALEFRPREDRPPSPKESRSEEHTSELQSLMRISYAVFCLKKKTTPIHNNKLINQDKENQKHK